MNDQLLTIADVARYTKLSRSKVYELCQSKKMPHLKIGKSVRVREADLLAWLKTQAVAPRHRVL